jgi:small subunit ribosomal protein S11
MNGKKIKEMTIKIADGRACLKFFSTFNNTIITITRINGDKICDNISSRTATGYKGAKKTTPFAAQEAAKKVLKKLKELGISQVRIETQGVGKGQSAAVDKICSEPNLLVESLGDKTPYPFNGCRPRKAPRK